MMVAGLVRTYSVLGAVSYGLCAKKYSAATIRQIATTSWLFALMYDTKYDSNVKSRYQLAGAVDNDGVPVLSGIQADTASMSRLTKDDSIYTRIDAKNLGHISCTCHKTRLGNFKGIFEIGFILGRIGVNNRAHINFTHSHPFDARNLAPGRPGKELDVVIIFRPEAMVPYNLGLSQNAILVTSANIPWKAIDLVYVNPADRSGGKWVLHNPDLIDRKIQGHTSSTTGYNADISGNDQVMLGYSVTGDCGWRRCPKCRAFNQKGSTSCLNCCAVRFHAN